MGAVSLWRPGDDPATLVETRRRGGLLFLPTESSYGIGADPTDADAVAAVFAFKGREGGKPLPVVLAAAEQVADLGLDPESPALAGLLARAAGCWPGPLTVVLPLPAGTDLPAAAGSGGIAVRVPEHDALRQLLAETGPLTATSANPSGETPVTDPAALTDWMRRHPPPVDAVVVDGGVLAGGPPSTLVRFDERGTPRVLRHGRLSEAAVTACLGGG